MNNCESMVAEYDRILGGKNRYFGLLKELGRNFLDIAEGHNYPKGKPNSCFNNAWKLATANPELTYVEGYAMGVIPLAHAWCVTSKGEVVETTWDTPGTEYYGIPFKTSVVLLNGLKSGYPSMLDNYKTRYVYETDPLEFVQEIPK